MCRAVRLAALLRTTGAHGELVNRVTSEGRAGRQGRDDAAVEARDEGSEAGFCMRPHMYRVAAVTTGQVVRGARRSLMSHLTTCSQHVPAAR